MQAVAHPCRLCRATAGIDQELNRTSRGYFWCPICDRGTPLPDNIEPGGGSWLQRMWDWMGDD